MPLPSGIPTVTVSGKYTNLDGSIPVGSVQFVANTPFIVYTPDSTMFIPGAIAVALDPSGYFSISLPATDNPNLSPTNFSYKVSELFGGSLWRASFYIQCPTTGGPINLGNVPTITPSPVMTRVVTSVNGKLGDVTLAASDVNALPSSYVAPVTSVNGKTGIVNLSGTDLGTAGYHHTQTAPSPTWTIVHNLGVKPAGVLAWDSTGEQIEWDTLTYPDVNTTVLTYSAAISGSAQVR